MKGSGGKGVYESNRLGKTREKEGIIKREWLRGIVRWGERCLRKKGKNTETHTEGKGLGGRNVAKEEKLLEKLRER